VKPLLLAILLAANAPAVIAGTSTATEQSPSLAWLVGEWAGSGRLFGNASQVTLSVAAAPDGAATSLLYRAQTKAAPGRPAIMFEGKANYRTMAKGRVEGAWRDSSGSDYAIGGQIKGMTMTTLWGHPIREIGRSTYVRGADDTLTVTDAVMTTEGHWRIFASATYQRK